MGVIVIIIIILIPFVLTGWNIYALIGYLVKKKEKYYCKVIEVIAMCTGMVYLYFYAALSDIFFVSWDVQLNNAQLHSMISPDAYVTISVIFGTALFGYAIIRFVPLRRQPPMVSALGISAIYLGMGICVLWCIQTISDFFLILLPVNCMIIFIKTIYIVVCQKNILIQSQTEVPKCGRLSKILNKAAGLPWAGILLAIPLLGIIIIVLFLFGQEPDSIIKAWTETADWTLSQKIPPPNIQYDEHYLCTVAAGGHRKVVKPIRIGIRHGHRVVVNRQLCIANAFEQVLEERTPVLHRTVRKIYDSTGYPISKHIHSKYTADLIYFLMKPLEWIFLFVLYTVDLNPENRIAVQYPHAAIPDIHM